tara:strand:+ start:701 stop:856 length:156 start_codon:yes stop_codon:yes gene_type:complete
VEELLFLTKLVELPFLFRFFFAIIVIENSIDYQFGDQIDFLDWIIGALFCV